MTVYEIWWFGYRVDADAKPEYRMAGPSRYGQHHDLDECKEWHGEHVCYIKTDSVDEMRQIAAARHPDWTPLPSWPPLIKPSKESTMIPALKLVGNGPGDAAVEANPDLMKAIERVIDLGLIGKPADYAEAYADLLDQISKLDTEHARKLAGTDWAKQMREAKYDGDRLAAVMDAFEKFSEGLCAS